MSDINETKLWSADGFREDDYIFADDLEAAGDAPAIIIPFSVWLDWMKSAAALPTAGSVLRLRRAKPLNRFSRSWTACR